MYVGCLLSMCGYRFTVALYVTRMKGIGYCCRAQIRGPAIELSWRRPWFILDVSVDWGSGSYIPTIPYTLYHGARQERVDIRVEELRRERGQVSPQPFRRQPVLVRQAIVVQQPDGCALPRAHTSCPDHRHHAPITDIMPRSQTQAEECTCMSGL